MLIIFYINLVKSKEVRLNPNPKLHSFLDEGSTNQRL